MHIAFRVDAGMTMGSGHVMRCATLAHALVAKGYQVCFYTRPQAGDLCQWLIAQGFIVIKLEPANNAHDQYATEHGAWLGTTQREDAKQTLAAIKQQPNFWIVDHYGLDSYWHSLVIKGTPALVIDDLADRNYSASLLLDQNLGRKKSDYNKLTSAEVLAGLDYVLLRPEFLSARKISNIRQSLEHIVITMGGVDQPNASGLSLTALLAAEIPTLKSIMVILGQANPHREDIEQRARTSKPINIQIVQGVGNMAERLRNADLAIGAAGTTSWERCAVGLPTIIIELAANQKLAAEALFATGAAELVRLNEIGDKLAQVACRIASTPGLLTNMSERAFELVDAEGTKRVVARIIDSLEQSQLNPNS
ncbi:UDP-2,4-diacetamido-2,4,6-trideoxy-beta-L-altropyranose hydrolase [Aliidiomarina quisquiliarum]|uniref:UDP-2,4-diacetamido-2,4, 6-trideoxy-beta-L-altropyranose hydrolase n=1 Tax=Aliidiomarina quisquiliarum TaxID=2938947 RepID=UPI00208EEADE|nr:UDP-2,4-diacetamido-2,4,6-trideoxy-beta-L-altropyranose hydrolase [Aliidiomarina quisquiliarum]MCO4319926.1 UDP-2,4-diacetamido-2,4,6-trideoxy-beta-L-altropyranose hydrolase [Aliidiomarina quisquiliarum]